MGIIAPAAFFIFRVGLVGWRFIVGPFSNLWRYQLDFSYALVALNLVRFILAVEARSMCFAFRRIGSKTNEWNTN
jgi:hypothetical protein